MHAIDVEQTDTHTRTGKVLNYASILDDATREQAMMTATMPFVQPYLALMPDAHLGLGATVGSVIPTMGAIMPAAVGVDIGCGMMAVRTQFKRHELPARDTYGDLRRAIEHAIPTGNSRNGSVYAAHTSDRIDALRFAADLAGFRPDGYQNGWHMGLGSLGGGNHFIEVSLDEDDRVWLFLHSGSRGIGNAIARHHIKVAADYCKRHHIDLPHDDLAYLVEHTPEFDAYIAQMQWAQDFARDNRAEMMDRLIGQVAVWTGEEVHRRAEINCHHNYTTRENHAGRNVWLSRKGAIRAREGDLGLIPGSMGTRSYVVEGRGNATALDSAPHGAGRVYGRRHAKRTFTADDLAAQMGDIEYRHSEAFVDEIPSAYKPIDVVMADASDLVRVVHTLRQIINVKGE